MRTRTLASSITPTSPVCSQPSGSIASAVRLSGSSEITPHHVEAAHEHLAWLRFGGTVAGSSHNAPRHPAIGVPQRARRDDRRRAARADRRDRARRLREPVRGHDVLEAAVLAHVPDQDRRHVRGRLVIARRSDDRSELPRRSWASSDWKIVGGPAQ